MPFILWISAGLLLVPLPLLAQGVESADAHVPVVEKSAQKSEAEEIRSFREAMRRAKNAEDMRLIRTVDSVGRIKAQMLNGQKASKTQLDAEQRERKMATLSSYCTEERFQRLAEIDSLPGLSEAERAFCKNQVRLQNPLKP